MKHVQTKIKISSRRIYGSLFLVLCALFLSCGTTTKQQEERLAPRRSTAQIRFDDIKEQVTQNPVKAIDLIGIYREAYRVTADDAEAAVKAEDIAALEKEATDNLRSLLEQAMTEERWDDAASYSRSLANLESPSQAAAREPDLFLPGQRKN